MQLAKTTFNHSKRDLNTKLTEVALAKRIESTYSKDEILEAYINRIFWGHTFMGLSAAARGYFNKRPSELTLSECAMLAGIIYGPNEFSPYKNPKGAKEVRNIVLQSLLDEKAISQEEYAQALNEEIVTHRPESRSEENYAMNLIRRELDIILEDENIRLGGLIVRTTLDLDLQNATIDAINKHLKEIESAKGYKHPTRSQFLALTPDQQKSKTPDYLQAACVAIDNSSGALYVVVGGRDAEESRFNRAVQSRRQVGSLFKPFVYATFFEKGYSASTQVSDGPIRPGEIAGAGRWSPRNSDNSFRGIQPASYGLVKSRNTMSVRVGHMAGLRNVVEHASLAGFQGRISMTPALYLGTWEASPLDIASAYTVFANGGVRPTPYMIETIADSEDQTLFYTRKTTRRVFSRRAAVMTSELLQQVTKPGGTAGKIQSLGFKAPCGGKTGTTNKYMNAWFSGFSSSITACVWVGFDRQRTIINKGYGATLALPIWVDVMKAAQLNGYPCGAIPTNANNHLSSVRLCRESNMIAHTGCIDAHTDYFETMPGIEKPTNMCNKHIPLALPDDEASIPNAIPVGGDVPTAEPVSPENIPLPIPVAEEPDSAPTSSIPVAEPLDEDGEIDENNNAIPIPN
jgi:penicillin-binding protein 1A